MSPAVRGKRTSAKPADARVRGLKAVLGSRLRARLKYRTDQVGAKTQKGAHMRRRQGQTFHPRLKIIAQTPRKSAAWCSWVRGCWPAMLTLPRIQSHPAALLADRLLLLLQWEHRDGTERAQRRAQQICCVGVFVYLPAVSARCSKLPFEISVAWPSRRRRMASTLRRGSSTKSSRSMSNDGGSRYNPGGTRVSIPSVFLCRKRCRR